MEIRRGWSERRDRRTGSRKSQLEVCLGQSAIQCSAPYPKRLPWAAAAHLVSLQPLDGHTALSWGLEGWSLQLASTVQLLFNLAEWLQSQHWLELSHHVGENHRSGTGCEC